MFEKFFRKITPKRLYEVDILCDSGRIHKTYEESLLSVKTIKNTVNVIGVYDAMTGERIYA